MQPLLSSINEAAQSLGIGRTSLYSLIKQGRLATVKIGNRTLIKASSILALIDDAEVSK